MNELQQVYENHDSKLIDLRKKCSQAEQKASDISRLGYNWQNKVLKLQDGLSAFEMTQIYEKIANNYNEAFNRSNQILNFYKNNEDKLGSVVLSTELLKNKSDSLLQKCDQETERKTRSTEDYT